MTALLTDNLPLLAGAPNGIKKLRELILELAVRGKLVPQDPSDEPASALLKRIAEEKVRLVAEGRIKKQKPLAEIGEDEKPFELPVGWEWARLGSQVVESGAGWSPSCEPRPREGNEWGVLKVSAVSWGVYQSEENKALPANLDARPEHEVAEGDFLVSRANTAELVARSVVVEATPSRLMLSDKIVRLKLTDCCDRRYVNLVNSAPLARQYYARVAGGTSSSMKNVSREQILNLPIALPPLAEQHRIVAKVDELMALCDRLEARQTDAESAHARLVQALLDSLTQASDADDFAASWQRLAEHFHSLLTSESSIDALKQTLLQLAVMGKLVPQDLGDEPASELAERIRAAKQSLLVESNARKQKELVADLLPTPPYEVPAGWEWQSIDDVLLVTGGVTLGRKLADRELVAKPYLRVANVQRGHLDLNEIKEIEVPEDEVEKYLLRNGDLLITEGGDWDKVGRTAIWCNELPECLHQNHVFRARAVTAEWESRWAELYLNSAPARGYFAGSSKQTTNLASINMTQLRACAFPLPPLAEQHRIVAKVDQLMALCEQIKTCLTQARQLNEQLASTLVEQAVA